MSEFVIFADASSDLPPDYLKAHDIRIIPMLCLNGTGNSRALTGFETDTELSGFYQEMRDGKMYSTSQITPGEYEEAFMPVLQEGKDILYLALSGGLTGTVESARIAAEKLKKKAVSSGVYVVDTLSASGGIDLLIEKAVAYRQEGLSAEAAAEKVAGLALHVCHVFMVTDLMYLSHGGRISGAAAKVGTMLHVMPILIINEEGKLEIIDKKRGERHAIGELRKRFENSRDRQEHHMYSAHGDQPEKAQCVEEEILNADPEARIEKRIISPVIGAHTGPALLSIIYFGDRKKLK